MKRLASALLSLVVPTFLIAGLVVNSAVAQEKAAKASVKPKVLLENDKVRVFEVAQKPGEVNTTIQSNAFRIVRALKGSTLQRTYADGKKETVVWKTGEVRWLEPGPGWTSKNVGKTEFRVYVVLLK